MRSENVEETLIASLKCKKIAAFDSFYNQYAPAFYNYIRQMLHQHKAADDTLASAFVNIWNHIEEYDPSKERFFIWSLKIVRKEASQKKIDLVLAELFACRQLPDPAHKSIDV